MKRLLPLALVAAATLAAAQTPVPAPAPSSSRGELLYATHCVACHSQQLHWREKRAAVDWPTLKEQVALWQGRALLGWADDDVTEVARYLNDTIYRYPVPGGSGVTATAAPGFMQSAARPSTGSRSLR